jgi:hypothetical protein
MIAFRRRSAAGLPALTASEAALEYGHFSRISLFAVEMLRD